MAWLIPFLALPLIAVTVPDDWVGIGETQQLAPGISVTPIAVVEDSRCPPDVLCIQAGKLVVSAVFENGTVKQTAELEPGGSMRVKGGMLTLQQATPPPPATTGEDSSDAKAAPLRVSYTFAPDTMS